MKKFIKAAVIFGSIFGCSILAAQIAQISESGYGKCRDGHYAGRQSGRSPYYKEFYTWAVSREFAKRFCMPEEYIADDLNGAEAIAYRYKPSGAEGCDRNDAQPTCKIYSMHWIEIYVKSTATIPKYDPEVKFFDNRDTFDSRKMIGVGTIEAIREKHNRNYQARKRGEVLEPPGLRNPYRGFTPEAEGKQTEFHYLARMTPTQVEERPAAYNVRYYQQNVYDGIDLIMLDGWGGGNFAGPRYKEPPLGFAIGVTIDSPHVEKLKYPNDFHYVIEMPKRVMQVMNAIDLAQGQRFEETVRSLSKQIPLILPTAPSSLTK